MKQEEQEYAIDVVINAKIRWLTPPKNNTEVIYREHKQTKLDQDMASIATKLAEVMNKSEIEKQICAIVNLMLQ